MNYVKWFVIRAAHVITKKYFSGGGKYGKYKLATNDQANKEIYDKILSGRPFACCRLSFVETDIAIAYEKDKLWGTDSFKMGKSREALYDHFGTDLSKKAEYISRFAEIFKRTCQNADVICTWDSLAMGDWYVSHAGSVCPKIIASAGCIEPFQQEQPWTYALKGKKVLVINPFSETIEAQYKVREHIWKNEKMLPEFELITLKAVWYSFAGKDERFGDWFEAYDYLFQEAMKIDFDVALLGCGLFGMPLAVRLKEAGKQAIHMGSAAQLLFGITGKRWDASGGLDKYLNEYWTRPPKTEAPRNAEKLDQACYW